MTIFVYSPAMIASNRALSAANSHTKKINKKNITETMSTRRDFIKQAALGAAALSVGELGFSATSYAKASGSSNIIRLGIAGVNARGLAIAQEVATMEQAKFVCVCDCDTAVMSKCCSAIEKITGERPREERDYRKMLEAKDIDAVIIAMPDHWHAPAAIMALKAGKHVYVEKPTSHNPHENELLLKAQAKYKKCVITVGNQRRSWPNVVKAIQEIHDGAIGEVSYAKCWYSRKRDSIGIGKVVPVPATLDWNLWQGPAPRVKDFKDNYLPYNWHWFRHWGTGEALNNGTHFVDLTRWALGVGYPTKVTSVGGRFHHQGDDWEFFDTQLISFQFAGKAAFTWEGLSADSYKQEGDGVGMRVYGDGASLVLSSGNSYRIIDSAGKIVKDVKSDLVVDARNTRNPSQELDVFHFQNWFDAITKGTKLNSTLEDACMSTQLVQLGNIAQFMGRSLDIDPYTGRIVNDKEAMTLWSREYEPGWEPKI